MRAQEHIVAISLAALAALAAAPAAASPEYPEIVQETLEMRCVPSCTICHRDTEGGLGTVTKGFGRALMSTPFELISEQEDQLRSVLRAFENIEQTRLAAGYNAPPLDCEHYSEEPALVADPAGRWVVDQPLWLNGDTDCDGMNDITELRQGRDPNAKGEGNLLTCALYGCGASRIDPHPTGDPTGFLTAVGVAGLLGAIWRRRSRALR
jgi:hypothetical protein